jgi:hypothetical protein
MMKRGSIRLIAWMFLRYPRMSHAKVLSNEQISDSLEKET